MKLRRLTLTNVRRFAGKTAMLGPFGDGLTTVTAENEAGKSTFFDALHALFFITHGSKAKEITALRPYSGGAVGITAEVDVEGKPYRIEKTYLSGASARVIDITTGQILKQQGDAEDWIETQINAHSKGPAGLLWVRQGEADVDPDDKRGAASNIAARRDLMSSVRGQIDSITGGRRMDRIMARCRREFEELSTANFKPKAQGPWKPVADRVEALTLQQEKLTEDVAKLGQALRIKSAAQKRLRDLEDPEQAALRAQQITQAQTALDHARHHAENVEKADQATQLADATVATTARAIDELTQASNRRARRASQIAQTEKEAAEAKEMHRQAVDALADFTAQMTSNEANRRDLMTTLNTARTQEKLRTKWHRLHQIATLRRELEAPQSRLTMAKKVLQGPEITQEDISHLTDLSQQISVALEQRRAHFASVTLTPDDNQTTTLDGAPFAPDTPQLIDRPLALTLQGYGTVHLQPAQSADRASADPEALRADLDSALQRLGVDTLADARAALIIRQRAQQDALTAQAEINGLVPEGIDALAAEFEMLCVDVGHVPGQALPEPPETMDQAAEIEAKIVVLERTAETLRPQLAARQHTANQTASAEATALGVLKHQKAEQAQDPEPADTQAQLAGLQAQHAKATTDAQKAQANRDALLADAPNLAAAEATCARLHSAAKADRDEIEKLKLDLARADGAIETQSEGAVEEKLADVTEKLATATQRSARYAQQARALRLLIDQLDAARKAAQDTYFEPIRAELHPLLAQLHSAAAFELDPEKMLVGSITRDGVTDDVSVLSGGAAEQVAILTRLAFAKLFAKQGRHVPVVLDDALVHTDDARITRMFDMLSQAAQDQQIIVLSCRTRAFSDLGGTRAFITVED